MDKPRIGFIGIGLMGHGIAKNLVTKGFPLTVRVNRNRAPLEDLLAAGAKEVKTNADVATNSDIVFLCVTGAPQVEEIVNGSDGIAGVGAQGSGRHRYVDERARDHRENARSAGREGRALRRRAACADAGRGGAGQAQHHGRRRRRDVRGIEAGPGGVLREHHPRRSGGPRHRAEAHQQLPRHVDRQRQRRSAAPRRPSRACRSASCTKSCRRAR